MSTTPEQINETKRVCGLIDVYTFATQCMRRKFGDKEWNAGPTITAMRGGRIISANRIAKSIGINTRLRTRHAKKIMEDYPDMKLKIYELPEYPTGKPDQGLLRQVADEVLHVILDIVKPALHKEPIIEWVMLDEIYIDLTDQVNFYLRQGLQKANAALALPWNENLDDPETNTVGIFENVVHSPDEAVEHAKCPNKYPFTKSKGENYSSGEFLGCESWPPLTEHDCRKALGMKLLNKIMSFITDKTGIHCTGGVGANKMMAKIACSIAPSGSLYYLSKQKLKRPEIAEKVPIKQLSRIPPPQRRQLKDHGFESAKDVQGVSVEELQKFGFSKRDSKLIKCVSKGYDDRPVITNHYPKNVNAARNFFREPLFTEPDLRKELGYLLIEFRDKLLEQIKWTKPRIPEKLQLSVSYAYGIGKTIQFPTKAINNHTLLFFINQIDYILGVTKLKVTGVGLHEFENGRKPYTDKQIEQLFWGTFKNMHDYCSFKHRSETDDPRLIISTVPEPGKPQYRIYREFVGNRMNTWIAEVKGK